MKLTKPLFLSLALLTLSSFANATEKGEELLKKNCASCHILTVPTPEGIQSLKAPAMEAVLFHVEAAFNNDLKKVKEFIMDYAQHPEISKSICESNKVAKFGVMPALKKKISTEDLSTLVDYIIKAYPTKPFVSLMKEMQTNGKLNSLKKSPFLMNQDALPHFTKILMENWEKGTLNLTKEQKEKLLVVREETMSGVKKIKQKLAPLESDIIEALVDEEELKTIQPKVDEVAKLKAEATMIHLKCLKESIVILDEKQLELLLPFWGM